MSNLYLKPEEAKFLSMAVVDCIETIQDTSSDQSLNWTPEARKDMKAMLTAGNSLREKLKKMGFDVRDLPPYLESDNDEFFTKQS